MGWDSAKKTYAVIVHSGKLQHISNLKKYSFELTLVHNFSFDRSNFV